MTEYTPSAGDVRARYVLAGLPDRATSDQIERARNREVPEFDRFLARVEREAARRAINELIADKEHMTALLRAENGGEAEDVLAHFRDTLHPEETPMTTAELRARSRTSTHDN